MDGRDAVFCCGDSCADVESAKSAKARASESRVGSEVIDDGFYSAIRIVEEILETLAQGGRHAGQP